MKVCLITLGCPKNIVEGESIAALVRGAGHTLTGDLAGAEAAIVHTCSFIHAAKAESRHAIQRLCALKDHGTLKRILVTGCMAQEEQESLRRTMPAIDVVAGTGSLHYIP